VPKLYVAPVRILAYPAPATRTQKDSKEVLVFETATTTQQQEQETHLAVNVAHAK
jgi:hypothetical protein